MLRGDLGRPRKGESHVAALSSPGTMRCVGGLARLRPLPYAKRPS